MLSRVQQLKSYAYLMRLDKPIGIFLLLWPTMWALLIASHGHPPLYILIVFTLGVILMRSAGCVINDIADRNFDGHVTRTQTRPLVTGEASLKQALTLFFGLCAIAFGLVLTLNRLTVLLAIPGVLLASSYPFTKRITDAPQLILGIAFSWSIPMAFAAINNTVPVIAWLLMLANILWTTAYDTEYAMVDREDDLKIGIRSTAILFGKADKVIIGCLQVATLFFLLMVGQYCQLDDWYYLGLGISSMLILYQQHLIRDRKPPACFKAFLNNHWVGLIITTGILLAYLT